MSFFLASFLMDLSLFVSFIDPPDEPFHIWYVAITGIITGSIVLPNIIARARLSRKIDNLHKILHQVLRYCCLITRLKIEALHLMDLMLAKSIGFYVGDSFRLDMWHLLLYFAENASILLLMVANMRR
ncbi:uncharacterized protein LOC128391257 isoform X2 [Panonychus citri]|uniref:uncharacterized protein LOC128391257 isoform X2 n=1 Tax=Panonychus citri TaxID=50023 RepID=UPI0023070988|nr:uncharacterized protein LOC128391257 isoform X2 [Panonychus citri]